MKRIAYFLVSICTLFLVGCSTDSSYIFLEDSIVYNKAELSSVKNVSLCMEYVYKNRKPEIKFDSLKGKNIENIKCSVEDITDSSISSFKYKGYNWGTISVELEYLDTREEVEYEITNIVLEVDNKLVDVELKDSIRHSFKNKAFENNVSIQLLQVPQVTFRNAEMAYIYSAQEDIIINNFYYEDSNITTDINEVYIDDVFVGLLEDVFPLEVKKDSRIKIVVSCKSDLYKQYQNVYTNGLLNYSTNNSKNIINEYKIILLGIYSADDVKLSIDQLIEQEKIK